MSLKPCEIIDRFILYASDLNQHTFSLKFIRANVEKSTITEHKRGGLSFIYQTKYARTHFDKFKANYKLFWFKKIS